MPKHKPTTTYCGYAADNDFLKWKDEDFMDWAAGECVLAIGKGQFKITFDMVMRMAMARGAKEQDLR